MPTPNRRDVLATLAGAASIPLTADAAPSAANPIQSENAKSGTLDWQLTYTRVDPKTLYRSPMIEGYVSRQSVAAGDTLDLFVSTDPPSTFHADLYRLG